MMYRLHLFFVLMILSLLMLSSCSHSVHHVHVSDFFKPSPNASAKLVQARSEQTVVLRFAFDLDYVDRAYEALQQRCPQGKLHGITTQYSTSHGFLHWKNKILMQGWCFDT